MKFTKNILVVLVLLLQTSFSFAASSVRAKQSSPPPPDSSSMTDGARILARLLQEDSFDPSWEHSGPTREDIMASRGHKRSLENKLISAVKSGNLEYVEALIAEDPDLEARDNEHLTVLMIAAKKRFTAIASRLIDAGARVDAMDSNRRTALCHAVEGGRAEIVKLLIDNGVAKHERLFRDLFMSAVFKGNNEIVKAFLVEGSRIDQDTLKAASMACNCSAEIANAIKELLA